MFNVLCLVPSLQALPAHQRQTDRGGGGGAGGGGATRDLIS